MDEENLNENKNVNVEELLAQLKKLEFEKDALLSKNKEVLDEKKTIQSKYRDLETKFSGVDLDEVVSLKKLKEEKEKKELLESGKQVEYLDKVNARHQEEMTTFKEQALAKERLLTEKLLKQTKDIKLNEAIGANKVHPDYLEVVGPVLGADVIAELDDDGNVKVYVEKDGETISVEDHVKIWLSTRPHFQLGSGSSGGAASNAQKGSGNPFRDGDAAGKKALVQSNIALAKKQAQDDADRRRAELEKTIRLKNHMV